MKIEICDCCGKQIEAATDGKNVSKKTIIRVTSAEYDEEKKNNVINDKLQINVCKECKNIFLNIKDYAKKFKNHWTFETKKIETLTKDELDFIEEE